MGISYWSSDVCSSDLLHHVAHLAELLDSLQQDHVHFNPPGPNPATHRAVGVRPIVRSVRGWPRRSPANRGTAATYRIARAEAVPPRSAEDRKSTSLYSSHSCASRMPYSA